MFIRIATGIATHFEARFTEWAMAGTITWWGIKLVGEEAAWTNHAAWANILSLMPENGWGWLCIALGIAAARPRDQRHLRRYRLLTVLAPCTGPLRHCRGMALAHGFPLGKRRLDLG